MDNYVLKMQEPYTSTYASESSPGLVTFNPVFSPGRMPRADSLYPTVDSDVSTVTFEREVLERSSSHGVLSGDDTDLEMAVSRLRRYRRDGEPDYWYHWRSPSEFAVHRRTDRYTERQQTSQGGRRYGGDVVVEERLQHTSQGRRRYDEDTMVKKRMQQTSQGRQRYGEDVMVEKRMQQASQSGRRYGGDVVVEERIQQARPFSYLDPFGAPEYPRHRRSPRREVMPPHREMVSRNAPQHVLADSDTSAYDVPCRVLRPARISAAAVGREHPQQAGSRRGGDRDSLLESICDSVSEIFHQAPAVKPKREENIYETPRTMWPPTPPPASPAPLYSAPHPRGSGRAPDTGRPRGEAARRGRGGPQASGVCSRAQPAHHHRDRPATPPPPPPEYVAVLAESETSAETAQRGPTICQESESSSGEEEETTDATPGREALRDASELWAGNEVRRLPPQKKSKPPSERRQSRGMERTSGRGEGAVEQPRELRGHWRAVQGARARLLSSLRASARSRSAGAAVRSRSAGAAGRNPSRDKSGHTPLQRAAAEGHVDVLQRLLHQRSDVDRQDEINGNGALHEAAWKGYSQSVDLLLKARANMYLRNRGGFTPLHLACQNGHNQTCRLLLLAGCSPDIRNSYGDTPLHTSARYGHAGVMRILISGDASLSEQNKNGDTALHIAAAMGRRKLTRILLDGGVDHALRNKQEETALEIALRKEHSEIVEMLRSPPEVTRTPGRREEKRAKAESGSSSKEGSGKHIDKKKKSTKVHFEPKKCSKGKRHNPQWSPYGCFYPPDTSEFPQPRLDTLPKDPLRKGEQYYLDLSGNIRKGPVGEGYTCYCAPFFRHVEDKLDKDKHELINHIDLTHGKLDKKIASLEKRTRTQLTGINELMRDRFNHERRECAERAERAAQRARCDLERRQGSQIRGVKDDLTAYLEGRLSALQMRESAVRRSGHHLSRSRSEELLTDLSDDDAASAAAEAPRPLRVVERPPEQRRGRTDQETADQTQLTNGAAARCQPVPVRPAEHAPRPPQAVLEVRNAQLRAGPPWPGDSRLPPGYVGGPPVDTAPPGYNNPNYVQYERVSAAGGQFRPLEPDEAPDQHNDSGYSTRIYGSSQGPSPALSGLPEDEHHPQRHPQTAPHLQQQQPPGRPAPGPRVQALQAQLSRAVEEPPPGIKSSLV